MATVQGSKCIYRLDDSTSATITLPDGRTLGYAEWGASDGKPVLYLHGHPGARLEASGLDHMGQTSGARVIAVERPGFGWSSPNPNATILSHVEDVVFLAEALKLNTYGVMGISGGGPYALACAAKMPADKLRGVSIICGFGPSGLSKSYMRWPHYIGFTIGYRYFPAPVLRWFFSREIQAQLELPDEQRLKIFREQAAKAVNHPKELDFLNDDEYMQVFIRNTREAYRQGFDARLQDGKLLSMESGFRLEDIRSDLPVQLWYGRYDNICPANQGEETAAKIGDNATLKIVDETHSSIYTNYRGQALEELTKIL